jgi:hypothetical protein
VADSNTAEGLKLSIGSNVRGIAEMGVAEVSGFEGDGAGVRRALFRNEAALRAVAHQLDDAVRRGERRVQVIGTAVEMLSPTAGRVTLRYKPRHSKITGAVVIEENP